MPAAFASTTWSTTSTSFLTTLCFEPWQRQLCTVDVPARPAKEGRGHKEGRAAEAYDLIHGLGSTSRLGQEHSTSVKSYVSRRRPHEQDTGKQRECHPNTISLPLSERHRRSSRQKKG